MTYATASIAAALAVALTAASADGAFCRKRRGTVVDRAQCKKKERLLDAMVLGAVGAPGGPGPAAPRLRVVDAAGREVGDFVTIFGDVVFMVADLAVVVQARVSGFASSVRFVYDAPGCPGEPWLSTGGEQLFFFASVVAGAAHYPSGPSQTITIASEARDLTPTDCTASGGTVRADGLCCLADGGIATVRRAATIDLSSFRPPFRAEVAR
jgi:hypothetical protein